MTESFMQFKSREEEVFWSFVQNLPDFVPEFKGLEFSKAGYENIRLQFGSVSYTPDFDVVLWDPNTRTSLIVLVETKGSKQQKGYRETRKNLNFLSGVFPEYVFLEVMVDAKRGLPASFEFISGKPFMYIRRMP